LKALLVSGKQVFSGHGLSVSMHPEDVDARRMRAMANALCTLLLGRMGKYAFLRHCSGRSVCVAPIWDA